MTSGNTVARAVTPRASRDIFVYILRPEPRAQKDQEAALTDEAVAWVTR